MMVRPKMDASTIKLVLIISAFLVGGAVGISKHIDGEFDSHEERPHAGAVAKDQYQIDQARFERKLDHLGGHILKDKWVK